MPFTPAQQAAIDARNPTLLVSAAAGSGKTAVLIERIYSLLSRDRLSIQRMLIVTFTRAAAAEMRERLEKRISQGAESDAFLREQLDLLETSQIGTLHGFCGRMIREFFEEAQIAPQPAQCADALRANLLLKAREETLDFAYEAAETDPEIAQLTAKFADRELGDMLDRLYGFLMSLPEPFDWLDRHAAHAYTQADLASGPMAEAILGDCRMLLSGALGACEEAAALSDGPDLRAEYAPCVLSDRALAEALQAAASDSLLALIDARKAVSFMRLPSLRSLSPEEAEARDRYKALRERIKKQLDDLSALLPADPQAAIADLERMQPALRGLAKLARELHRRFQEAKAERDLIDFTDLEHKALRVLSDPAIRREVSARFDAVFVDEYQDTSGIQQAILDALRADVSRETSARGPMFFYVGDVKQSIYRFRQADPTLFLDKLNVYSPEENAPLRRISLNRNFRSRENVLASVNRVFESVMRPDVTELTYDADARLYAGLPSRGDPATTLRVFCQPGARSADRPRLEALTVAREIERRVGSPVYDREGNPAGTLRYRDIAVLLPTARGVSEIVARTLSEYGIPVYSEDGAAGMESPEIAQALEHLRLLSNLENDIALLAALRGPVFAFTEPELAAVRLCKPEREASFLDALKCAAESDAPIADRAAGALQRLTRERFLCRALPLDEYLWDWLARSGLYGFYGAQPGGKLRQANLRMLCQKASDCVRGRGGDLTAFLESVADTAGVSDGGSPTVLSPWEDVVRVMTIHKSKGLEFPVVIVMGLGDRLHKGAQAGALAMHPRLGVALRYVNEETRTTRSTLLASAIGLRARAEEKAERARVLYVAMTRAKDELLLLGAGPGPEAGFSTPSAYAIWQAKSLMEWARLCARSEDGLYVCGGGDAPDEPMQPSASQATFRTLPTSFPQKTGVWRVVFHNAESDPDLEGARERFTAPLDEDELRQARLSALLRRALGGAAAGVDLTERVESYCEPDTSAPDPIAPPLTFTHEPFKVGVTALCRAMSGAPGDSPASADGDLADREPPELKRLPLPLTRPKRLSDLPELPAFLRPEPEATGVLRGTATHKALSMLDFAPLREALLGAPAEPLPPAPLGELSRQLDALATCRRLTAQERGLADARAMARFFTSPEGRMALSAPTVMREWGFNLRVEGGVIAQGVIDLCCLIDGAWELIDYKTDAVDSPAELWALYGPQIELYRRALTVGTRYPVRRATLFSLSLGAGESR